MADDAGQTLPLHPIVPLSSLFLVCLKIGVLSFGGGLSGWLHQEFVTRHGWISDEDFASSLAISQMLPGANVVNLVVCMGEQLRGPLGALVCAFGFLVGPFFAVIAMSAGLSRMGDGPVLQAAMTGVAAAAIGLLLVMFWRSVRRYAGQRVDLATVAVVGATVGLLQWPLIAVVMVVAPISVYLAWRRTKHEG